MTKGSESLQVRSRIWIDRDGRAFLGGGRVALLECIASTGSISQAARELGISYRKAWGMVEAMERTAEEPMVERDSGGKGGGGTRLTAYGRRAVKVFRQMEQQCRDRVDELMEQARL